MAEISNIFPKNAPEQLDKMTTRLNSTNEATKLLLETTKQLAEILKQSNITYAKITEAQKGAVKVSQELTKQENTIKKNAEAINALQTNRAKTIAAQTVAKQKLNKELKDGARLEAANTKVQKQNIVVAKAQKGSYDAITAALVKNVAKWKSLTQAERDNTKAGQKLTAAIKQQDAALKKLDSQIGRSQRHVGNYKQALKGVATQLLGALGVVGGIAMFVRVLKGAFTTLRSFTKENAVLAGVLGKTRKEITALTGQAIALGSIYPVTASEVVKLQVSFARLGFTMAEIQNLTEATILGSIALNAELDATATLVGAVVKAYANLGTTDAQLIIDQLTLATQRSSLSFVSLETALPKVASAASAMNIPLSKTLALLGMAHDATLDASTSGTSLRNIFLELAKRGITLEEALGQINNSTNRLTVSYDLFGKRGAIVGLTLADNIDKIDEFTAAINDAGGVSESVAKEQMATLDGSIKGLGSSWEKFVLGFKGSEGVLRKVIDSLTLAIDTFSNDNISSLRKLVEVMTLGIVPAASKIEKRLASVSKNIANASVRDLEYTIKTNEEKLKNGSKTDKLILEMLKNRLQQQKIIDIAANKDRVTKEKLALKQAELEKLVIEKENADKITEARKEAEEKANKEIEAERKRHFNELRRSNEKFVEDAKKEQRLRVYSEYVAHKEIIDSQDKLEVNKLAKRSQQQIENTKQRLKEIAQFESDKLELINMAGEAAGAIASALSDRKIANLQKEFDILMLQKEAELANDNLTAEQKQVIEEKYAKKAAEIKTKQAKAEKKAAIIDVVINTAVAVSKVWGQTGIFGLAAQIPVLIMGALQAGLIASQPIPEFSEGTHGKSNAPSEFIAGEKGRERMTLKTGQVMMVDKPTHFKGNKYKGATIDSNSETEKIIAQSYSQGNINFDTQDLKNEMIAVRKAIQKKPVSIVDNSGRVIGKQSGNYREIYLERLQNGR